MDERSIAAGHEAHLAPPVAPTARGADAPGVADGPLADQRALTILTTEHWHLLSARSLVYNEAFARAGMFLALFSATLVALGLIATATGFSDSFLAAAAVLLALDLFVGLASIGRINAATNEDIRYLQGMNRLRHAYLEMVPELDQYFITSGFDDYRSVTSFYGQAPLDSFGAILHGFTTAAAMVAVICSAVAGALAAVILILATHDPRVAAIGGGVTFIVFGTMSFVVAGRQIRAFLASLDVRFPRPGSPGE